MVAMRPIVLESKPVLKARHHVISIITGLDLDR
jgi:hypothetical protein